MQHGADMRLSDDLLGATDDEIRECLTHAHIPALMCSLVHMTGDFELIRGEIRPHAVPMGNPNQSLSEEERQRIQDVAFEAIRSYRDGCQRAQSLDPQHVSEMIEFITGEELSHEYTQFALSELSIDGRDTYAVEGFESIPETVRKDFRVAVVGAGMSGILAAIRLKKAGIPYVVLEKNSDVGGTWFENRYPGCRVDSPNHVYSYSFAPKDWPQHFSDQEVLLSYFKDVAEQYDVRPNIRFNTEVENMRWINEKDCWQIYLRSPEGDSQLEANAVIVAVGQLNRPKLPDLPGRDDFRGKSFHSAEWDSSADLSDKRVAIIGTGASAFQFTPHVVRQSKQVDVYLRTPPWVAVNPLYQAYITQEKHWLLKCIPFYAAWFRFSMFWTSGEGLLSMARCDATWDGNSTSVSEANDNLRKVLTRGIETQLADRPDLIAKLTPNYPPASKRMLIDDGEWYRSLKEEKVSVIDAKIERITETGLALSDGSKKDYDVIVFGTGFQASRFFYPMRIYGMEGTELREKWGDDPRAYRGITIPNYPNLFTLYGPNTNIVVNGSIIFFSECEMVYVLSCLRHLLQCGLASMDCRQEVHDIYNVHIDRDNRNMAWGASTVNAWYKNQQGRVTQCWPGTLIEFWKQCKDFKEADYEWSPVKAGRA